MHNYITAIEAAGAVVHAWEAFGSYQGDWWAKVTYNGQTGFVTASYGSCSGCDSYQATFDYEDEEKPDFQERLAAFGKEYLDEILTFDEAITRASKHLDWDMEAQLMVDWIKSNA